MLSLLTRSTAVSTARSCVTVWLRLSTEKKELAKMPHDF